MDRWMDALLVCVLMFLSVFLFVCFFTVFYSTLYFSPGVYFTEMLFIFLKHMAAGCWLICKAPAAIVLAPARSLPSAKMSLNTGVLAVCPCCILIRPTLLALEHQSSSSCGRWQHRSLRCDGAAEYWRTLWRPWTRALSFFWNKHGVLFFTFHICHWG